MTLYKHKAEASPIKTSGSSTLPLAQVGRWRLHVLARGGTVGRWRLHVLARGGTCRGEKPAAGRTQSNTQT